MSTEETRQFYRHPTRIAVSCCKKGHDKDAANELRTISHGGMTFVSEEPYFPGDLIEVTVPVVRYKAVISGEIVWSMQLTSVEQGTAHSYINGLKFRTEEERAHARLIEQICHIEAYRSEQTRDGSRVLTSSEAAAEWIEQFAADFPP